MRRSLLPAVLTLGVVCLAAAAAWAATASFTPPPEQGNIFAVIRFDQRAGSNQHTRLSVQWGPFHRSQIVGRPYGLCADAEAGIILMIRHLKPDSNLFTLSTSGTILREPYQGEAPPEVGKRCFKLVKFRARY